MIKIYCNCSCFAFVGKSLCGAQLPPPTIKVRRLVPGSVGGFVSPLQTFRLQVLFLPSLPPHSFFSLGYRFQVLFRIFTMHSVSTLTACLLLALGSFPRVIAFDMTKNNNVRSSLPPRNFSRVAHPSSYHFSSLCTRIFR